MRKLNLTIAILITQFLMACSDNKINDNIEPYITMHGKVTLEEDTIEPPEPRFKSRFNTLEEWLTYLCKNEKPDKEIDTYNFGLFEGQNDYTLYLTGTNTYQVSKDYTRIRIEFSPTEMYYSLSEREYQGLKRDQVYALITGRLKEFTKTATYRDSYFVEAKQVKTEWSGEKLSE